MQHLRQLPIAEPDAPRQRGRWTSLEGSNPACFNFYALSQHAGRHHGLMQALSSALASRAAADGRGRALSTSGTAVDSVRATCRAPAALQAPPSGHRRRRCLPLTAAAHRSDRDVGLHTQEPSIDADSSSSASDSSAADSGPWTRLLAAPAQLLPRALAAAGAQLASSSSGSTAGDSSSDSEAASPAMNKVVEVYENQRLFAVVWKPPPLLDRPEWSDGGGNPVLLATPPSEDPAAWELVVTGATDDEGFQYATVFK